MIIKGTLIAKDVDIKVAITVEITVTCVFFSLRILIGILIVRTVNILPSLEELL